MFITEWDRIRPSEAELAAIAEEEKAAKKAEAAAEKAEGKSKKKDKKKEKAPPLKTYPHHKYEFAPIGPSKMDHLENCMHASKDSLDSAGPISLSYFTRADAPTSQMPIQTPEERAAAKELIAAKKAKLLSLFPENPALEYIGPVSAEEAPAAKDEKKAKDAKPKKDGEGKKKKDKEKKNAAEEEALK